MRLAFTILVAVLIPNTAYPQNLQDIPPPHVDHPPALSYVRTAGIVEHNGATGKVTGSNPRPLLQAIIALENEYKDWIVDYEDPPYATSDSPDAQSTAVALSTPREREFEAQYAEAPDNRW